MPRADRLLADARTLAELGVASHATFGARIGVPAHTAAPRLRALVAAGLADRGQVARTVVYVPKA